VDEVNSGGLGQRRRGIDILLPIVRVLLLEDMLEADLITAV
jgi:hypothetical protein